MATLRASQNFSCRGIRIRSSSVEQNVRSGEQRSGPSEEHAVEKNRPAGSFDSQAQEAQGTMRTPESERPVYVHGKLYKDNGTGTAGASTEGNKEEAAPTGWWEAMKKKMGMNTSEQ